MNNAAKIFIASAALIASAGVASAEAPAHPQEWAHDLHSSIPAQGNSALHEMQQDIRQRAGNIEADFLPPQVWSLKAPQRDDRSRS